MIIQNQQKRIVAVHDLSCIGRLSLMAVVPILTNMGLQVCPLPTAVLSCHTQFPDYTFLDLTEEMKRIIANWKKQQLRFHAFYTGYLGSPQQVQADYIMNTAAKRTIIDAGNEHTLSQTESIFSE